MTAFYRGNFTTMWVKINSGEPLGILDSGYIEDYNGDETFLTLRYLGDNSTTQVAMVSVPAETPGIPDDVFQGPVTLSGVVDGDYEIQGRVRDVVGNYTIIGAVDPGIVRGDEQIISMPLTIYTGYANAYTVRVGNLTLRASIEIPQAARVDEFVKAARVDEVVDNPRDEKLLVRA